MKRLLCSLIVLVGLVAPVAAQTSLNETTLSAAASASATTISLTSATGVSAGYGIYVDQEFMVVAAGYVSGTTIPVIRGAGGTVGVSHAASVPVWIGPQTAFIGADRSGSCVAANEAYLPQINIRNGAMFDCSSTVEKWVDLRKRIVVTCQMSLFTDMIDRSCFTADRPYLVHKITYVSTVVESGGTLTVRPMRQQGTEAAASGDLLATAISGVSTVAQTVTTYTLSATESFLILETGNRLGIDFTDDTAGELSGVLITFYLIPL